MHFNATKTFRVFGMQRSGNHAIINWMSRNAGLQDLAFFNNLRPGDVLKVANDIDIAGTRHILKQKSDTERAEILEAASRAKTLIVSYENKPIRRGLKSRDFTQLGNTPINWVNVSVNRSFLNWLASYVSLAQRKSGAKTPPHYSPLGIAAMVREYVDFLSIRGGKAAITIDYDRWVVDAGYRARRLKALGLEVVDNSIGERQVYGKGSSFEGRSTEVDPAAQLGRWKEMQDNHLFSVLVDLAAQDDELLTLLEKGYPADAAVLQQIRNGRALQELRDQ